MNDDDLEGRPPPKSLIQNLVSPNNLTRLDRRRRRRRRRHFLSSSSKSKSKIKKTNNPHNNLTRCPDTSQFAYALDLPLRRPAHQHILWLNSHFIAGCHCYWISFSSSSSIPPLHLLCDPRPHYYSSSLNQRLVSANNKPLLSNSSPLLDHHASSLHPVHWPGHYSSPPNLLNNLPPPLPLPNKPTILISSSSSSHSNNPSSSLPSHQPPSSSTSDHHSSSPHALFPLPPTTTTPTATSTRLQLLPPFNSSTPTIHALDTSVTPTPAVLPPPNIPQLFYTSTSTVSMPNYTAPPVNSLTTQPNNSLIPPQQELHDNSLGKALGGTFGGILGLSLLLIAGVLLARRRSAGSRESLAAGLRHPSLSPPHPTSHLPAMIQIPPHIGASPPQPPNSNIFLAPADPTTRYSSNGTGLLSKLRGTTASLQHAGLITPSPSLEDMAAHHSHLAETILDASPNPPPSQPLTNLPFNPTTDSGTPRYDIISNPFASEPSLSSDHHLSDSRCRSMSTDPSAHNPRQSLATDLSYPNGSLPGGGLSSGEIEAVRFGSQHDSVDDQHAYHSDLGHRDASQPSDRVRAHPADGEQAWWGGP